ncbi:MAG TPA: transcription-repair coupling factor [Chlamydiales bacterium]
MLKHIKDSPSLKAFQEALREGGSFLLEELWDVPRAIIALIAAKTTNRSVILLTGSVREDRLFENLSELAPDLVLEFPAWETLPGEEIAPSPDILGKRMEALDKLTQKKGPSIVLCPVASFLQKVTSSEQLKPLFLRWKKRDKVSFNQIPEQLTALGYRRSAVVSDKGEFAVRGGIVDLFPVSSSDPFRLDFFGDEIEEIRTFDPVGQKSIGKVEELFISPANELSMLQKSSTLRCIADYFSETPLFLWDDLLAIEDSYVALKTMPGAKSSYFFSMEELLDRYKNAQHLFCAPKKIELMGEFRKTARTKWFEEISFEALSRTFQAKRFFHSFQPVADYFEVPEETELLDAARFEKNLQLLFLNSNETEEREVKERLAKAELPEKTSFEKGYLTAGFIVADIPMAVIPNAEISHRTKIRRQKWRSTYHTPASEFHALQPGDLAVHFHSGIGRYLGMEKQINHLGVETEFLTLEYAEKSKLFVPLSQAYLVSRYIGADEAAPTLSQLGSKRWQTTRQSAQAQIVGYASDLLKLYAERAVEGGVKYPLDSDLMKQFENDFPYQETEDQLLAINALKNDLCSGKAMDRLVCGDVGYGKTEVAMRAAFKAVVDGKKQVAVLVPTTVLAMQHYETFSERMRGFPIRVDVVSRLKTAKETKKTLNAAEAGQIDILVGTHRLLSQDIRFKDLGLIIIDEEQRFGVRAKEHLKKLKTNVACLTLSATPIPRTLYMSLVSARDMSVINTPPQDRLPVKTILAETDLDLITNALLRELARGGQAFFIHNRVESIYERAKLIGELVPSARIGIVHGQMDADDADVIFHKFKSNELDLLFATTIVENGIDIPNANTILIDRADTYGIADLYQLRGRVGRWNRAAYAYFLIPKDKSLPDVTRKRLNALVEASGYGGGMKIAMRDLEIRGAGDILGVQQSGQVSSIGFHLYCKLLKKAIEAIKKQKPISFEETKVESPFDARFPEDYISEVSLRMELYYRLGEVSTFAEISELFAEIKDRFGDFPPSVYWLYHLTRLRAFATANRFTLLKFGPGTLIAEQQTGKTLDKRNLLLPKKFIAPEQMESTVFAELKKHFPCEKDPSQ